MIEASSRILGLIARLILLVFATGLGAGPCFAADLIFPGAQPKLEAGAGQTVTRGATALFYNPANLIFSKFIEPDLDISFASVTYTYQHTDTERYKPAVVKVSAPPVTLGLGIRPIPSLSFGVAFLPTGTGAEQLVNGVPLQVTGTSYQLCNVSTKQTGYKIAAGAAFRFDFPFTIGLGLINTSEKTALLVTPVDESTGEANAEALVDAIYAGTSNQFLVGMRSEILDRAIVIALSYKTAVVKTFKGDYLINLDENSDYQPYEGKGYAPAVIGFGAEARFGNFGFFLDFQHETWSAGRTVYKRGLGNDGDAVDFIDVNDIAAGLKWWVAPKHMITVAGGIYGANKGDGTVTPPTDDGTTLTQDTTTPADPVIKGVAFGDLEAVPRTVFSGGYRAKLSGAGYVDLGAQYQTGKRLVPPGADGEGLYTLSVIMLTVGAAYGF